MWHTCEWPKKTTQQTLFWMFKPVFTAAHPQNVQLLNVQLLNVQLPNVQLPKVLITKGPDYQTSSLPNIQLPNIQLQY